MNWVNTATRAALDAVLTPFAGQSPWLGLALLTLFSSAVLLWVYKRTSNQTAIAKQKDRRDAALFEIRLYNDDLGATFRALGQILKSSGMYFLHSLPPLLWVILPLGLLFQHMLYFYEYEGLQSGQNTLVTVRLQEDAEELASGAKPEMTLTLPTGLETEAGPAWAPALREMTWRVGILAEGDYEAVLGIGGAEISKSIRATQRAVRLSPRRPDASFLAQMTYCAEAPITGAASIEAIDVAYPTREWAFGLPWWGWFFILIIPAVLVLRKPMGVEI